MFNFGFFRFGFVQGGVEEIREMVQRMGMLLDVVYFVFFVFVVFVLVDNVVVNVNIFGVGLD